MLHYLITVLGKTLVLILLLLESHYFSSNQHQVLELLEVLQFKSPDTTMKLPQIVSNLKLELVRF